MLIIALLWFVLAAGVASQTQETFYGDQVLRVIPKSANQVNLLKRLRERHLEVDFWQEPDMINHDVDFRVPKNELKSVKTRLEQHRMSYKVLIDDVQRVIDQETESIIQQRLSRSVSEEDEGQENYSYNHHILNNFNSHDEINEWIERTVHTCGSRCSAHIIGVTGEGRTMKLIKIGSRNKKILKSAIWIDGGIHGREWISPTVAINIVYKLINSTDRCTKQLTDAYDWYVLPVANPDGYEYSRNRNRMWRKNRKVIQTPKRPWWTAYYYGNNNIRNCYGVDLNRNFGFSWGEVGTSTNPCSDVYGGSSSFSEPETVAIRNFTKIVHSETEFKIYLSLHSYGQYLLYSWGYTRALPEDYQNLDDVASYGASAIYQASNKKTQYTVGSAARTLYSSSGASDDWAKGELGAKYAFTMELPPSDANSQGNGFLLPVSAIKDVAEETWPGIKAMAAMALQKDRNRYKQDFCIQQPV